MFAHSVCTMYDVERESHEIVNRSCCTIEYSMLRGENALRLKTNIQNERLMPIICFVLELNYHKKDFQLNLSSESVCVFLWEFKAISNVLLRFSFFRRSKCNNLTCHRVSLAHVAMQIEFVTLLSKTNAQSSTIPANARTTNDQHPAASFVLIKKYFLIFPTVSF